MAQTRSLIRGITAKITATIYIDDGVTAANLTGVQSITFIAKKAVNDPDSAALFTKTVGSGILVTDTIGGICEITINPADTNTLSYGVIYYEIVVKLADNTIIRNGIAPLELLGNLKKALP